MHKEPCWIQHDSSAFSDQTAICFLPLRLRADRTFLPPLVLILDLKPCTFARCLFLGWYVIFAISRFLLKIKARFCPRPTRPSVLLRNMETLYAHWGQILIMMIMILRLYPAACGCGIRGVSYPSLHPEITAPAAPTLPAMRIRLLSRAYFPRKVANSKIIYKSCFGVKKYLSTRFPLKNVDKLNSYFFRTNIRHKMWIFKIFFRNMLYPQSYPQFHNFTYSIFSLIHKLCITCG